MVRLRIHAACASSGASLFSAMANEKASEYPRGRPSSLTVPCSFAARFEIRKARADAVSPAVNVPAARRRLVIGFPPLLFGVLVSARPSRPKRGDPLPRDLLGPAPAARARDHREAHPGRTRPRRSRPQHLHGGSARPRRALGGRPVAPNQARQAARPNALIILSILAASRRVEEVDRITAAEVIQARAGGLPHRICRQEPSACGLVVPRPQPIEARGIDSMASPSR